GVASCTGQKRGGGTRAPGNSGAHRRGLSAGWHLDCAAMGVRKLRCDAPIQERRDDAATRHEQSSSHTGTRRAAWHARISYRYGMEPQGLRRSGIACPPVNKRKPTLKDQNQTTPNQVQKTKNPNNNPRR